MTLWFYILLDDETEWRKVGEPRQGSLANCDSLSRGNRLSQGRLLVVDDELGFREFVGKVAASAGYEVEVTSNAREFMRLYESFDPTLIVLDMILPEMDGFELMQWLIAQKCEARILVVTGYNPQYAEMAETIGTNAGKLDVQTLTKPIALTDLRAALD